MNSSNIVSTRKSLNLNLVVSLARSNNRSVMDNESSTE